MIEKLVQCLAAVFGVHGRVDEFAQVLNAGIGFGCIFRFEDFDVASAVNQEFEDLSCVGRTAGRAEAFDGFGWILGRSFAFLR